MFININQKQRICLNRQIKPINQQIRGSALREAHKLEWLVLFITGKCNLHCRGCFQEHTRGILQKQKYEMSLSELEDIIYVLKQKNIKIQKFGLTGGEPLLAPNLRQICKMLLSCNICDQLYFYTNGLYTKGIDVLCEFKENIKLRISKYGNHSYEYATRRLNCEIHDGVFYPFPLKKVINSVPGECWCGQITYCDRRIYPCPCIIEISDRYGLERKSCELKENWIDFTKVWGKFEHCAYCVSNCNVRSRLKSFTP